MKIKIVLCTGCFDVIHRAHRLFLQEAKKQGDVLVVGLESDERIKKLKGEDRPKNKLRKRIENLRRIKWVDVIFPLPDDFEKAKEHLQLVQLIEPAVLALSESTPHLEEKKVVIEKFGGRLFVFGHMKGYSSSKAIREDRRRKTEDGC